jgi:hypothetical protein
MQSVTKVKCGWKWLEGVINDLITGINQRTVIAGSGIEVNESTGGVMISLGTATAPGSDTGSGGKGPGAAGAAGVAGTTTAPNQQAGAWAAINVVTDDGVGGFTIQQMYVWSGGFVNQQ